ncbi:MAG: dehydrogenase [Caldilineaceae bacterium SB0668_bin_21]|nr:dehydrogenase [Caldilineaceae bacterium SB0668_bin_21]
MTVSGAFPLDLDYDYCFANGIRVLSAAPAFGRQVAEMALGMAIACARGIVDGHLAMQDGTEIYSKEGNVGNFNLYGKRVGLIGFGGLARSLHPLLEPFGCHIVVYDAWLGERYLRRQGVTPVPLEELMETSQFIFVLAVPSDENRALLDRDLLECIRPDAALILVSRAHLVDFDALTELLHAGRFRAAIDVFPQEPLDPAHPIRSAPNVVLSAHRAGSVKEAHWEIGEMVLDDLEAIAKGLPPQRMQRAEPELAQRYASTRVKGNRSS